MKTSRPQLALACALAAVAALLLPAFYREARREGRVRLNRGGEVAFTIWPQGADAYSVSLANKSVLLVGDSMAEGLAAFLRKRVEAAGGRFYSGPEQSSTIIWWQGSGRFRQLLAQYRPDIVFIALGSNELYTRQPEQRAPVIKQMVAELGERSAYWIGPPSWKPGAGLVRVIDENFQADHLYNSDELGVPRGRDGKHPTLAGYEQWANLFWDWFSRAG